MRLRVLRRDEMAVVSVSDCVLGLQLSYLCKKIINTKNTQLIGGQTHVEGNRIANTAPTHRNRHHMATSPLEHMATKLQQTATIGQLIRHLTDMGHPGATRHSLHSNMLA